MEKTLASHGVREMVRTIDSLGGSVSGSANTRTLTLPEQIAEKVADSIIAGRYPPGCRLSEQELADQFEVSRGPIREAFRILEKEGFVRILPRRGTEVTRLTPREVEDIFQVRACLMGMAGRLTTLRITPEVRRGIVWSLSQIDRLAEEEDIDEFLRLAYQLSMFLADSSGNEKLQAMILSMARQTLALTRRALTVANNRRTWAKNWHSIATAVLAGDTEAAERAARQLVNETGAWATRIAETMESDGG